MSDTTGRLVGDRSGQPGEHRSAEAQIRTARQSKKAFFLQNAKQELVNTNFKQLEPKKSNDSLRIIMEAKVGSSWKSSKKSHRDGRVKEVSEFCIRHMGRRKLIEDQNTILELSGRVQELQNEVNYMNDSKEFQDAESIRSGNSNVTRTSVISTSSNTWRNVATVFRNAAL